MKPTEKDVSNQPKLNISGELLKEKRDMNNHGRQIDKKPTKQIRIDAELHQFVKVSAAKSSTTIKALLERCLMEFMVKSEFRQWV